MSVAASSSVKCEVGVLTSCRVCRLVRVTAGSSGCGIYRFLFTEEEASPSRQKWICPCSRGVSLHFDLRGHTLDPPELMGDAVDLGGLGPTFSSPSSAGCCVLEERMPAHPTAPAFRNSFSLTSSPLEERACG